MDAIESFRRLALQECGTDYIPGMPSPRYNIQKCLGNERRLCEFFTKLWGKTVVELADVGRGLCDTRLDAGTICGSDVLEFKTSRHALWEFDVGRHNGVGVQVHKVEGLRNACGRGSWQFTDGLSPFGQGWYVYWDMRKKVWALNLDEIENLIVGQKPRPIVDEGLSYSIRKEHWRLLGVMESVPAFEIDDGVFNRHAIGATVGHDGMRT